MICGLCGTEEVYVIHEGCRDDASINVLRCKNCGLVYLDSQTQVTDSRYEEFGMKDGEKFDYDAWLQRTYKDDVRRAKILIDFSDHKPIDICDFGCGNGGFLRQLINNDSQRFTGYGVELKKIARSQMVKDGIPCNKEISDYGDQKFDIITLFHVIEHLTDPKTFLETLKGYLKEDGIIIIETPNADEALIKRYHCKAYMDFTYWSEHVYLYTSGTLEALVTKAGYHIITSSQLQRYPLINHMFWLTKGKSGGHVILQEYLSPELEEFYSESLKKNGECDTLLIMIKK